MQKQGIAQTGAFLIKIASVDTRCYKLLKEVSDSVRYPGIYDH